MRLSERLELLAACAVVPVALEVMPASRVLERIAHTRDAGGARVRPLTLARRVDRVLARLPWVWRRTCLRRAAVLAVLLRRHGHRAQVVIGVRRDETGALQAHAWLRCDGEEPFLEPDDIADFVALRSAAHGMP